MGVCNRFRVGLLLKGFSSTRRKREDSAFQLYNLTKCIKKVLKGESAFDNKRFVLKNDIDRKTKVSCIAGVT